MSSDLSKPKTLLQIVRMFADEQVAFEAMRDRRWPNGVSCPFCTSEKVRYTQSRQTKETKKRGKVTTVRRLWSCNQCRKQFTLKTGTIFEDSPIGFSTWLPAMWMIANAKNGVSSYEIHRGLGVTQKTAWFMLHRIRAAMQTGSFEKLRGVVEADETMIGGKARNMHKERREKFTDMVGGKGKTVVFGAMERGGKVVTQIVPDRTRWSLQYELRKSVERGAILNTDEHSGYRSARYAYVHQVIDHSQAYVQGQVHTNSMENFWSCLKRTIGGTYVSVEPFQLFRYLDEQVFRFNEREGTDSTRFEKLVTQVVGKRLTYNELTGKESGEQLYA